MIAMPLKIKLDLHKAKMLEATGIEGIITRKNIRRFGRSLWANI